MWGTRRGEPTLETPRHAKYLPKAPYVLTILRGLKELFMTCLGLSKLRTTGMLSQATRTPRARLAACRIMQPGPEETVGKLLPPGLSPKHREELRLSPAPQLALQTLASVPPIWAHKSGGWCCWPQPGQEPLSTASIPPAKDTFRG